MSWTLMRLISLPPQGSNRVHHGRLDARDQGADDAGQDAAETDDDRPAGRDLVRDRREVVDLGFQITMCRCVPSHSWIGLMLVTIRYAISTPAQPPNTPM